MFSIIIAVSGAIIVAMCLIYACDNLEYSNDEKDFWS